jgi:bifunctional NMN adenylyltransferase/nudix hydrolase
MKKYNTAVVIGRFQPFTLAHKQLVLKAIEIADNVLFIIGSASSAVTLRNPFTYDERLSIIQASLTNIGVNETDRLSFHADFIGQEDSAYNYNQWVREVQEKIDRVGDGKKVIVGYKKDKATEEYLKCFPNCDTYFIKRVTTKPITDKEIVPILSATDIRNLIWKKDDSYKTLMDSVGCKKMEQIIAENHERFNELRKENLFIENYKKSWEVAPYPPTFVTTDALVICNGHVLLIERGRNPGKGLYAMPGGFLDQNETIIEGCIRELKEETKIKFTNEALRMIANPCFVADSPFRDARGRTISHVVKFEITTMASCPEIRAADDASNAKWVELGWVKNNQDKFFGDHWAIIEHCI